MTKPEIQSGSKFETLPEDDYNVIITGYRFVDRMDAQTGSERWDDSERRFFEADQKAWAEEQEKESKADPSYHKKPYPSHRQYKYWFDGKVVDGEHRGRFVPRVKTTVLLSSHDLNGLFKFLKVIPGAEGEYASLKERIDNGDSPDLDEEVVGKVVRMTIEHNTKGYPKVSHIAKSKYKPTAEDIAELVLGAKVNEPPKADDLTEDIPF